MGSRRAGYAKGRARRVEIIEQATVMFGESGYRGTSLRDIAARCGMSHPGLLHHFPTKESLLIAVLEHRDDVDGQWPDDHSIAGATMLEHLVEVVERNAGRRGLVELYTVLSAEATAADHPAHGFFVARYDDLVASIANAYEQARADGRLRVDGDPVSLARELVALLDGLQVQWLLADGGFDMGTVVRLRLAEQLAPPTTHC